MKSVSDEGRLREYMGQLPIGLRQLHYARLATLLATLCQACCPEPVLRLGALLHDLTLHDITALQGEIGARKEALNCILYTRASQNPRLRLAYMSDTTYTGNLSKKVNLLLRLTYTH